MENARMKTLILVLASISLVTGSWLVWLYRSATAVTEESLRNDAFFVYDTPTPLQPFSLVDHHGDTFDNSDLAGEWTLVFFGYTFCPDICPLTMASLKQFYDLLDESGEGGDVQVVMISVDPKRDTPEVMGNYVTYFNPGFIGVTGEYAEILTLTRQMNIAFSYTPIDDENYLVNHNGEVMLIDPDGQNVGFFKPPYHPDVMLKTFRDVKRYLDR